MELGFNALFLAVLHAKVGGGAAIDLFTVCGVAGLATHRLQSAPIKGHGGELEILVEGVTVACVECFLLELVEHQHVGAVTEGMRGLAKRYRGVGKGLLVCIQHPNAAIALAVLLDTLLNALHQRSILDKGLHIQIVNLLVGHGTPPYS